MGAPATSVEVHIANGMPGLKIVGTLLRFLYQQPIRVVLAGPCLSRTNIGHYQVISQLIANQVTSGTAVVPIPLTRPHFRHIEIDGRRGPWETSRFSTPQVYLGGRGPLAQFRRLQRGARRAGGLATIHTVRRKI